MNVHTTSFIQAGQRRSERRRTLLLPLLTPYLPASVVQHVLLPYDVAYLAVGPWPDNSKRPEVFGTISTVPAFVSISTPFPTPQSAETKFEGPTTDTRFWTVLGENLSMRTVVLKWLCQALFSPAARDKETRRATVVILSDSYKSVQWRRWFPQAEVQDSAWFSSYRGKARWKALVNRLFPDPSSQAKKKNKPTKKGATGPAPAVVPRPVYFVVTEYDPTCWEKLVLLYQRYPQLRVVFSLPFRSNGPLGHCADMIHTAVVLDRTSLKNLAAAQSVFSDSELQTAHLVAIRKCQVPESHAALLVDLQHGSLSYLAESC